MGIKAFKENSSIHEQLLVGYLWNTPDTYKKLRSHNITAEVFTDQRWEYFYFLGKDLFEQGARNYDEKTVYAYLTSKPNTKMTNWLEEFDDYGGFEVILYLKDQCVSDNRSEEYHLQEIQKYYALRTLEKQNLINTSDKKLVEKLCRMNVKEVRSYYQYKINETFQDINYGEVIEDNLLDEKLIDETIEEMDKGVVMGLPLHNSGRLNRKIKGWRKGTLTYLVLSSGTGKSSFGVEKFVLSLIENRKKGLLFLNEENSKKLMRLILATVSSRILNQPINRERMNMGNLDKDGTKEKLMDAKEWLLQNEPDLIKVFHLKKYRLEDVINRIELYRPLGYEYAFLDTFKPERGGGQAARWETFSNNAQELFDTIKPDTNDVGMLATVQLKIGKEYRYLDLSVIGKSGEIVEVADLVLAGRMMYDDEYPGEKKELKPYNYTKDANGKYKKKRYSPNPNKKYLILFIPKNREGGVDEQILFEVNYGLNAWQEVAYVQVPKTSNTLF